MKKKHFILDVISFSVVILNVVSVFCFFLPPGRAYYMPEFLVRFTMLLTAYAFWGGLAITGILGFVLNIISIFYKKEKDMSIRNNVVYIILFILTIPLAWLLFNMAMSV